MNKDTYIGNESAPIQLTQSQFPGSLAVGRPFPMLKYLNIFQIKYTEAILSNRTRKQLWFKITKILIALEEKNLLCHLL